MIFAIFFFLIAAGFAGAGYALWDASSLSRILALGFWSAAVAEFATGSFYAAASVFKVNPGSLFKTRDGRLRHLPRLLMWPYLILEYCWWRKYREKRSEPLFEKVEEGLWLGSLPAGEDVTELRAAGINAELDLVSEMQAPPEWRRSVRYLCLPTLDGCAPTREDFALGTEFVRACRAEGRGVLIHCTFGHGRSAAMMAASLVELGAAPTLDEAWGKIRRLKRIAYLSREQREMVERFLGQRFTVKTQNPRGARHIW